jgi:hypothetical protein
MLVGGAARANVPVGGIGGVGGGGGIPIINPCAGLPSQCCQSPTAALCQNATLFSQCTNWDCNTTLSNALQSYAQSLPNKRTAYAPDGTNHAGSNVSTPYVPYDYVKSNATLRGLTGNYFGSPLNHTAYVLNPGNNGQLQYIWQNGGIVGIWTDPQAPWQNDGTRVSSCEEYTYKRYTTLSNVERGLAPYGNGWTAFQHLFWFFNTFFEYGQILDEQGNVIQQGGWPSHLQNLYLTLPYYNLPLRIFTFDPQVDNLFKYLGYGYYGGTTPQPAGDMWSIMNQVQSQVNEFGEDLIEKRYVEMKAFVKLMETRAQLNADFQTWWQQNGCDPKNPSIGCNWKKLLTEGYIANVDAQLNQSLLTAMNTVNEDCFAFYPNPTACTISPHQLIDEYLGQFQLQREHDYDECVRMTGNRFDSYGIVGQASSGGLASAGIPAGDYAASSASLKNLFGLLATAIGNVQLPIDPSTGRAMIGDRASDVGVFGSSLFGANYSYEAGWQLTNLSAGVCHANVHVKGTLAANATLLGTSASVVDFLAQADTSEPSFGNVDIAYQTHFRLLGADIYSPVSTDSPAHFDLTVGSTDKSGKLWSVPPIVIPVGPINVNVTGGMSGGVGFDSTLAGGLSRNCGNNTLSASVNGVFTPYAHLDAFAQAALGIPSVLEAGIRGTLTLVRIDLPFTNGIGISWDGTGLTLNGSSNLDLKLTSFGGKIAVFLDSLLYSTELSLIEWPGVTTNMNLFNLTFNQPLEIIRLGLLGRGGEDGNVL